MEMTAWGGKKFSVVILGRNDVTGSARISTDQPVSLHDYTPLNGSFSKYCDKHFPKPSIHPSVRPFSVISIMHTLK